MTRSTAFASRWRRPSTPFLARLATLGIDFARRPLAIAGIDVPKLRAIVETRLVLDARSDGSTGLQSKGLLTLLGLAFLSGIPVGLAATAGFRPELWMALIAAQSSAFFGVVLIHQLGPILVESGDVAVIGARPVPDRTLFAARLVHLATYALVVGALTAVGPLALGGLGYRYELVLLAVPIVVVLSLANAIGVMALLFALILRVFGPSRFQRAAMWMQLVLALIAGAGAQVVVDSIARARLREFCESESLWRFALPPLQAGQLFGLFNGDASRANVVGALLAVATPLVLLAIALGFASKTFRDALAGENTRGSVRSSGFTATWFQQLGDRLCRTRAERAGFGLGQALGRRDRTFWRVSLAGLGFVIVAIAGSIYSDFSRASDAPEFSSLSIVYIAATTLAILLHSSRMCESPDARWIYSASPLSSSREVTVGVAKALIVSFAVPLIIVLVAWLAISRGIHSLPDAAFAAAFAFALGLWCMPFFRVDVPFTRGLSAKTALAPPLGRMLALMGISMAGFAVHILASRHWISYTIASLFVAVFAPYAWRRFERLREPEPLEPSKAPIRRTR